MKGYKRVPLTFSVESYAGIDPEKKKKKRTHGKFADPDTVLQELQYMWSGAVVWWC